MDSAKMIALGRKRKLGDSPHSHTVSETLSIIKHYKNASFSSQNSFVSEDEKENYNGEEITTVLSKSPSSTPRCEHEHKPLQDIFSVEEWRTICDSHNVDGAQLHFLLNKKWKLEKEKEKGKEENKNGIEFVKMTDDLNCCLYSLEVLCIFAQIIERSGIENFIVKETCSDSVSEVLKRVEDKNRGSVARGVLNYYMFAKCLLEKSIALDKILENKSQNKDNGGPSHDRVKNRIFMCCALELDQNSVFSLDACLEIAIHEMGLHRTNIVETIYGLMEINVNGSEIECDIDDHSIVNRIFKSLVYLICKERNRNEIIGETETKTSIAEIVIDKYASPKNAYEMAAHAIVLKICENMNFETKRMFLEKRLESFLKSCWTIPSDWLLPVQKADKLQRNERNKNQHLRIYVDTVMDLYVKTLGEDDVIKTIKCWLLHTQKNINTDTTGDFVEYYMSCCRFLNMFIAALGKAKYQILESLFDVCDSFISQGIKIMENAKRNRQTSNSTTKPQNISVSNHQALGLFTISMSLYRCIVLTRNGNCQRYRYWLADKFFKALDESIVYIVIRSWMNTFKVDALCVVIAHKQVLSEKVTCSNQNINKLKIDYVSMFRLHIAEQKLKQTRQHKLSSGKFRKRKKKTEPFQNINYISQQTISYVDHMTEELQKNGHILSAELNYYRTMRSVYFSKELLPCLLREPWSPIRQQLLEVLAYRVSPPIISKTQIRHFESKKHSNGLETQDTQCLTPANSPTEVPMVALYHTFCRINQEIPKISSEKKAWESYVDELDRDIQSLVRNSDDLITTVTEITEAILNVICNIHFSASAEARYHLVAIKDIVLKLVHSEYDFPFRERIKTSIKEQFSYLRRYQLEALVCVASILDLKTVLLTVVNKISGSKSFVEAFNGGVFYLECCLCIENTPMQELLCFLHYYRCRVSYFTVVNEELSELCEKYDNLISKFPSELIAKGTKPLDLRLWVQLEGDVLTYGSAFFHTAMDNLLWYRHCAKIWYKFEHVPMCCEIIKHLISRTEENAVQAKEKNSRATRQAWEWLPIPNDVIKEKSLQDENDNQNSRKQSFMTFLVFIHEQQRIVKRKTVQRFRQLMSNPNMLCNSIHPQSQRSNGEHTDMGEEMLSRIRCDNKAMLEHVLKSIESSLEEGS